MNPPIKRVRRITLRRFLCPSGEEMELNENERIIDVTMLPEGYDRITVQREEVVPALVTTGVHGLEWRGMEVQLDGAWLSPRHTVRIDEDNKVYITPEVQG